jgi:hypothetical protein
MPLANQPTITGVALCHIKVEDPSFTLSFAAINNHNWFYSFFVTETADDPLLYVAKTILWFCHFKAS